MSKHDSNPKRDSLDQNVDELLAQMAAGKVITDEGAVSVEEIEARKPKPKFTGTELLDDGQASLKRAEPSPIALDTPIADTGMGQDAAAAAAKSESLAEPAIPEGPISDTGAVRADGTEESVLDADAQLATETASSPEASPSKSNGNPVAAEAYAQGKNLGKIPEASVNPAESATDVGGPEAATVEAQDGTEPSGAEAAVAPAESRVESGRGESVPELAEQLDSLLSGADAAGQHAGEELSVESLEVEAEDTVSAEAKDAGGAIESLNAELEAAAAKVETTDASVEAPAATPAEPAAPEPEAAAEPAPEPVAAKQSPVESPAAQAHTGPAAASPEPATAPAVVEPKGPGAIQKLKVTVLALGGNAALSALALASLPLKNANHATRDTIGWVGLWTAFLGVCVWFYVLVLHTPAPPFVPAAAIRVVENTGEGEASGGHEKAAAKPPAKPAAKSEAPGGGHEKPKTPAKPAAKPAKKAESHAAPAGH